MASDIDTEALVRYVVESLVDHPEDVEIEKLDESRRIKYEVRVHDDDVGKVIGRGGRIIKSIRTIARAAGILEEEQVYVDVIG